MKKTLFLLLAALSAAFVPVVAAAATAIAQMEIVRGRLTNIRSGVLDSFELHPGADIIIGDTITAWDASSARLSFPDGSHINITPGSAIRINQYIYESDKYVPERKRVMLVVRVLKGSARFAVNPAPLVGYQIFIETETARVSGGESDFVVTAFPEETRVVIFDGGIEVGNILTRIVGTVMLHPNQKTVVKATRPPEEPVYMMPKERRAFLKETRVR